MITVIKTGSSFKGAGLYYLHDKKREGEQERLTTERVAWTHARNTLHDAPEAVLSEMRQTAFDQQQLKMLSGNRIDGRPTDKPVMTLALSWHPSQKPTQEQMIQAGEGYLRHMGWQDHQALFVAHKDTEHPHIHLIVNTVNPETGMALDASWTKNRSHQWALKYEREQGQVLCAAREGKYEAQIDMSKPRGQHMNRAEWETWQKIQQGAKAEDREFAAQLKTGEWNALKDGQRQQREGYYKETGAQRKELREAIRAEVKTEFAPEWAEYAVTRDKLQGEFDKFSKETSRAIRHYKKLHSAVMVKELKEARTQRREDIREQLGEMRADIIARQNERIEELAKPALERLGKERRAAYQEILKQQQAERGELKQDQAAGIRRRDVLQQATPPANQNAQEAAWPSLPPKPHDPWRGHVEQAQRAVALEKGFLRAADAITPQIIPKAPVQEAAPAERWGAPPVPAARQEQAAKAQAAPARDPKEEQKARTEQSERRQTTIQPEMTESRVAKQQRDEIDDLKRMMRERGISLVRERGGGGRER